MNDPTPPSVPDVPPPIADLWVRGDPAASGERFRAALAHPRLGATDPYRVELMTQLARALGLAGDFPAAHAELDRAAALLGDRGGRALVRLLLERGRAWNGVPGRPTAARDVGRAREHFVRAWEAACDAGIDDLALDAAHMLGIIEPPEEAIAWSERALELAAASKDDAARGWIGTLCNNLGWTYHDAGRFDRALELFERGVAFRAERGQRVELRMARYAVGRCQRSLGRIEEALALQSELVREIDAAQEAGGYVFEEMAECLHALGRVAEARPYFARAARELGADDWLVANEPARLARLRELGDARS